MVLEMAETQPTFIGEWLRYFQQRCPFLLIDAIARAKEVRVPASIFQLQYDADTGLNYNTGGEGYNYLSRRSIRTFIS